MRETDWPDVSEIYRQGIMTGEATFIAEAPSYERWNSSHHEACRLVAETDGKVLAWAALSPVSGSPAYRGVAEISIYVRESCRGRAIGRALLEALVEDSERNGFWSLRSMTFEQNAASIRLQESCGFRQVGLLERPAKDINGHWRNTVMLERRSKAVGTD
jgi:phosphinothricin acetyltransferase